MQCQICHKNEATIHLTEIVDGARKELHTCEQCAAEQGITVKGHLPINELLGSLLSVQPTDDEISGGIEEEKCPHCGFTLERFREETVLGCPYDYELFEEKLEPLIKKAHNGRTVHCGKTPENTPEEIKNQIKILNLRQQLDNAVRAEDYELAAKLRDIIKGSRQTETEQIN